MKLATKKRKRVGKEAPAAKSVTTAKRIYIPPPPQALGSHWTPRRWLSDEIREWQIAILKEAKRDPATATLVPPGLFLNLRRIIEIAGLSEFTLRHRMAKGSFPRPIPVGSGTPSDEAASRRAHRSRAGRRVPPPRVRRSRVGRPTASA